MNKVGLRLLREVPLLVTAFFALYGCATQPDGEVSASGVCQETLVQGADLNYGTDNSINDYEHEGTGWINPTTGRVLYRERRQDIQRWYSNRGRSGGQALL